MPKYFTNQDFDSFMPLQSNLFLNLFEFILSYMKEG
uniref:Uncharacterized protein n=1 Tax=viral metagenome TaxID=1070528 RepID=A0A6C0HBK3_9ZZZZ